MEKKKIETRTSVGKVSNLTKDIMKEYIVVPPKEVNPIKMFVIILKNGFAPERVGRMLSFFIASTIWENN